MREEEQKSCSYTTALSILKKYLFIILGALCLLYASFSLIQCKPLQFDEIVKNATQKFNSQSTYFEIYERDYDRLIITQPFGWIFLSNSNYIFALSGNATLCSPQATTALKFECKASKLIQREYICLEASFDEILEEFTFRTPDIFPFVVKENVFQFSIMSALEILVQNRIVSLCA